MFGMTEHQKIGLCGNFRVTSSAKPPLPDRSDPNALTCQFLKVPAHESAPRNQPPAQGLVHSRCSASAHILLTHLAPTLR